MDTDPLLACMMSVPSLCLSRNKRYCSILTRRSILTM